MSADSARQDRRALRLLAAAAVTGVACGFVFADATPGAGRLPPGWIAEVNGRPILADDYARAVAAFARDRREPPSGADRARILDTLVDEELLFQAGLASGFVDSDRSVREAVLRAMIESVVAESATRAVSEEDLRALYRATRETGAPVPPFEAVRPDLEAALAARARDEALRAQIDELRARGQIERVEGSP